MNTDEETLWQAMEHNTNTLGVETAEEATIRAHEAHIRTKEGFAQLLNGREYGEEMDESDEKLARDAGLVVVFGVSDDLMEFRGAIDEELGAYDGQEARIFKNLKGVLSAIDEYEWHDEYGGGDAPIVKAIWGEAGTSWRMDTELPHATFRIYEESDLYCIGLVFAIADLP